MLRITIHDDPGSVTFLLEGKLAGSWVQELERLLASTVAGRGPSVVRGVPLDAAPNGTCRETGHNERRKHSAI